MAKKLKLSKWAQRFHTVFAADPAREWYGLDLARSMRVKAGTLYVALAELESKGLVTSRWEHVDEGFTGARRRLYKRTGGGH